MSILRGAIFLLGLGFQLDRARLIRSVVLMLMGYIAAPVAAVELGRFADDAISRQFGAMPWMAVTIAALLVIQLMAQHFAHLDYFELAEMQDSELRSELIDVVNHPVAIEHLDNPAFADTMSLVREDIFNGTRSLEAVLQISGLVLQTAITVAILISLSPWLALLPLMAVLPVVFARKAQAVFERARDQTAAQVRLSTHLLSLATEAKSLKELRVFAAEAELLARQESAWRMISMRMWRGQAAGAALRSAGQIAFALGYGGAILLLVRQAMTGHASIGDLVVVITLAVQVSSQIAAALQLLALLQTAAKTEERIGSLRGMAAQTSRGPTAVPPRGRIWRVVPERINVGIRLEHVSFTYPGSGKPALHDVCLELPPGRTLALVGENGAGKSTLVKLLAAMYAPTSGRILIDGADMADIDAAQWRAGMATLFQDFYRFEFTLHEGIGLGDLDHLWDTAAVSAAVTRARAQSVIDAVPGGLAGLTGHGYGDGTELSGGQWQLVGLARCLMRRRPQLLILDEPAAALDPTAEHALFERYASSASAAATRTGGITILVSHRFSTVLMADTIAVLEKGRLSEYGNHEELMARGGLYTELFRMQARAYR